MYFKSIYYSSVILVVKILPNIDTYVSFFHIYRSKTSTRFDVQLQSINNFEL